MTIAALRTLASAGLVAASLAASLPASAAYSASAVPFTFTDISATGTNIGNSADDLATAAAIGFNFSFFGVSYNSLFISSNGLVTFGSGNSAFTNSDLTSGPASIAPYWDDLRTDLGGGDIFTQVNGAAGNRTLIIQWNSLVFFNDGNSTDTITFQALLFEASGNIQFNYLDLVSEANASNNGASATVGIKDAGAQGPDRLLLAFNDGPNAFVGTGQSTLITLTNGRVPEPASLALLGIAIAALGAMRRRTPVR